MSTTAKNLTHADLCALWPTDYALAADLQIAEITEGMAKQWRRRNFVPSWWWPEFIAALKRTHGIDISTDELMEATRYRAAQLRARRDRLSSRRDEEKDTING